MIRDIPEAFFWVWGGVMALWSVSILILVTRSSRRTWRRAAACVFSASTFGLISLCVLPITSRLVFRWIGFVESLLIHMGLKSLILPLDPLVPYLALAGAFFVPMAFGAWLGWWMTRE